jgi:hypothetical protein
MARVRSHLGKIGTYVSGVFQGWKLLYGIQYGETEADRDRATFFSLDLATLKRR